MNAMSQAMQVLTSRGTTEWYTPPYIIEMARQVLGTIDLDPASSDLPQTWIKAARYYTKDDDALTMAWDRAETVWLNPPFEDTPKWVKRLMSESGRPRARTHSLHQAGR